MVRSVALKDAWVGRTTSKVFGLVLALVFGLASIAIRANGGNFILDKQKRGHGHNQVHRQRNANDTVLDLRVQGGEEPSLRT